MCGGGVPDHNSPITAPAPASAHSGSRSGQRAPMLPAPCSHRLPSANRHAASASHFTYAHPGRGSSQLYYFCVLSSTTLAIINVGLSRTATAV